MDQRRWYHIFLSTFLQKDIYFYCILEREGDRETERQRDRETELNLLIKYTVCPKRLVKCSYSQYKRMDKSSWTYSRLSRRGSKNPLYMNETYIFHRRKTKAQSIYHTSDPFIRTMRLGLLTPKLKFFLTLSDETPWKYNTPLSLIVTPLYSYIQKGNLL